MRFHPKSSHRTVFQLYFLIPTPISPSVNTQSNWLSMHWDMWQRKRKCKDREHLHIFMRDLRMKKRIFSLIFLWIWQPVFYHYNFSIVLNIFFSLKIFFFVTVKSSKASGNVNFFQSVRFLMLYNPDDEDTTLLHKMSGKNKNFFKKTYIIQSHVMM